MYQHTQPEWYVEGSLDDGELSVCDGENEICQVFAADGDGEANARLIAAVRDLRRAAIAHHAWSYAEEHYLGTFDQRGVLCVHAQALTDAALAKADGSAPAEPYEGMKRLIVWPQVRLEAAEEAEAEALVRLCLEHEAANQKEADAGNGAPAGA